MFRASLISQRHRRVAAGAVGAVAAGFLVVGGGATAQAAFVPGASCTFTDGALSATSPGQSPNLQVTTGDAIQIACTGAAAGDSIIVATSAPGVELDTADAQALTNVPGAAFGNADASGNFSVTYPAQAFGGTSTTHPQTKCPQTQAAANAGLGCVINVADADQGNQPLGAVVLDYINGPQPIAPVLTATPGSVSAGSPVTIAGSGFFGSPVYGTGGTSPVPGPTVLVDGSPVSNAVTSSAATFTYGTNAANPDVITPGGVLGGNLTISTTGLTAGPHTVTIIQANTTPYTGSGPQNSVTASTQFTIAAAVPAVNTTTTGSDNPTTGPIYSNVTLSTSVTPASGTTQPSGTVNFVEGTTTLASVAVSGGTTATATVQFSTVGTHTIQANFVPSTPGAFNPSSSATFTFVATAAVGDVQNIATDVSPGTITITTPYTAANPLVLPPLALSTDSSYLSTSATFTGITVADTRAGNPGWNASAVSSVLTNVAPVGGSVPAGQDGTINSQNVGLTALAVDTKAPAQVITFTNNYAADGQTANGAPVAAGAAGNLGLGGTPKVFESAAAGAGTGTATTHGTLTIIAPTTVSAGHYTGVVTFTVA